MRTKVSPGVFLCNESRMMLTGGRRCQSRLQVSGACWLGSILRSCAVLPCVYLVESLPSFFFFFVLRVPTVLFVTVVLCICHSASEDMELGVLLCMHDSHATSRNISCLRPSFFSDVLLVNACKKPYLFIGSRVGSKEDFHNDGSSGSCPTSFAQEADMGFSVVLHNKPSSGKQSTQNTQSVSKGRREKPAKIEGHSKFDRIISCSISGRLGRDIDHI